MTSALRHIVDDVRDRLSRMRMRETSRTEVHPTVSGDGGSTNGRRRTSCTQSLSTSSAMSTASRNLVNSSSSSLPSTTTANGIRTDTPDLIRPHSKIASLPPLPPGTHKAMTSSGRTSRHCDSSATYMSMHVYEEIPTLSRRCRRQRQGSATSAAAVQSETIGRVYYISPIDGALCRLYPTSGSPEELVERPHQLVCSHVRPGPTSRTVDIAKFVAAISTSVHGGSESNPYGPRGRELRLCSNCRRELRENLGDSWPRRDVNTCDLSLLHVPCPYWSDNDDNDDDDYGGKNSIVLKEVPELSRRCSAPAEIDRKVEQKRTSADNRRSSDETAFENRNTTDDNFNDGGGGGRRQLAHPARRQHSRPRLGVSGSSAFVKYTADRRNSLPAATGGQAPSVSGGVNSSPNSPRRRIQSSFGRSIENLRRLNNFGFHRASENDTAGSRSVISPGKLMTPVRDERRRPIVARNDDVIIIDSLAVSVDDSSNEDGYLCLYDCQCDRCRVKFAGRRRSKKADNNAPRDTPRDASRDSSNATGLASKYKTSDAAETDFTDCVNRNLQNGRLLNCSRDVDAYNSIPNRQLRESISVDSANSSAVEAHQIHPNFRRPRRTARSASQRLPLVRSVYYNGLLASMIDLTGCDVAASDSSADGDFRLSCRATSGPRSWGRDMLLRSKSSQPETDSYENADVDRQMSLDNSTQKRQRQPWHKRRVSWARNHRPSMNSVPVAEDVRKQSAVASAVALHRSVGDLQLSSLQ